MQKLLEDFEVCDLYFIIIFLPFNPLSNRSLSADFFQSEIIGLIAKDKSRRIFSHRKTFLRKKENYCNEKKYGKIKKLFFAIMVKYLFGHPKKEPFLLSEAVSILRFE